jgi:hypothetical protein
LPGARPRLQAIRWLCESLNTSSALAVDAIAAMESTPAKQIFMTWFIRIIPIAAFVELVLDRNRKIVASRAAGNHKVIVEA